MRAGSHGSALTPPWTIEEHNDAYFRVYSSGCPSHPWDCAMLPVRDQFRYRTPSLVVISRRQFNFCLLQLPSFAFYRRALVPSFSFAREDGLAVSNGQSINLTNVGRAGAALYRIPNYSDTLTTVSGDRTYSTNQTIRNMNFTGYS